MEAGGKTIIKETRILKGLEALGHSDLGIRKKMQKEFRQSVKAFTS